MEHPDLSDEVLRRRRYWRRVLTLTAILLALWFVVGFVATYFARDLSFDFFGWPFSFWVGAQGALFVFIAIVAIYERAMRRLDRRYGFEEPEDA
ncbi:MAG: DUF4212 domain-containing protein [Burkholderiaceae bacterium]|nr:DUF4212 domain-containing protein [Burkholderiaceae bacterium]